MIFKFMCLLLFNAFSNIYGAKFRFDYTYNRSVEGWLKFHPMPVTWSNARLQCHAEGAILASPLTEELTTAIVELFRQSKVQTIFTGVHSTFSKGVYASIEGVPLTRMSINWAPGEPNNLDNSESCLAMQVSNNGSMKDVRCYDVFPFVCYKKKTKSLVLTSCGTHDAEYNLDKRTDSCYKFHRRGLNWQQAYLTCMAEGGYLVVMNSDQEAVVLKEVYAKHPANTILSKHPEFAFIGLFDSADGGSWMTIHGETPTEAGYAIWHPGQPGNDSQPLGEFCGAIDRNSARLLDAPCHWLLPFICEKTPESLEDADEMLYQYQ